MLLSIGTKTIKTCSKCCKEKPLSGFGKLSPAKDGRQYCCRTCRSEAQKKRKNPRRSTGKSREEACLPANMVSQKSYSESRQAPND